MVIFRVLEVFDSQDRAKKTPKSEFTLQVNYVSWLKLKIFGLL